jgi:fused signal recognition particle receptor
MTVVYILIALAAALAIYFLLLRKGRPARLEAPPDEPKLPEPAIEPPRRPRQRPPPKPAAKARAPKPPAEPRAADTAAPSDEVQPAVVAKQKKEERPEEEQEEEEVAVEVEFPASGRERAALAGQPDVEGMRRGLARSRAAEGFFGRLRALFGSKKEIEPTIAEDIEEVLLASDVGVKTTQTILDRVRDALSKGDLVDSGRVWEELRTEAVRILSCEGNTGSFPLRAKPTVVLMVGVNGCGKTTTIGKLAARLQASGLSCVLAAGDTFRAAAVQQLVVWGKRIGCEVVRGKEGADPASVIFDSIKKGLETGADVVLADTAGRLHTKANLMSEMKKIAKTAGKAMEGAPHEILLVIDATNGQNALTQATEFKEALDLTGIVLTKLDGTAKGGMILGICDTLKLPVRFLGLGERPDDLHEFSPQDFVEALLGKESEADAA